MGILWFLAPHFFPQHDEGYAFCAHHSQAFLEGQELRI